MANWNKHLALSAALLCFTQPYAAQANERGGERGADFRAQRFLQIHGMTKEQRDLMRAERREERLLMRAGRNDFDPTRAIRNQSATVQPAYSIDMLPSNLNLKSIKNSVNLRSMGLMNLSKLLSAVRKFL